MAYTWLLDLRSFTSELMAYRMSAMAWSLAFLVEKRFVEIIEICSEKAFS